jgi:hypothetical protein
MKMSEGCRKAVVESKGDGGKLILSESEIIQLMSLLEKLPGLEKLCGTDKVRKEINGLRKEIAELKTVIHRSGLMVSDKPSSGDFSQIENKIKKIEEFLKFRESIHSDELLSQASYFMDSVPDEIKTLERGMVSGIEYTRRRDILRFGLNIIKIYFETLNRPDLAEKADNLLSRVKKL